MKFKYKFSNLLYILFVSIYVLAVVCFVLNLIRLINGLSSEIVMDSYKIISTVLCLVLPIVISIFLTALIISSYYEVKNKTLTVKFGFIGDKYPTKDIESIVRNVATNLLVINFKDQSTLKVVIDSNKFDDFASSLMKEEKGISYGETDETDKKRG